MKEKESTTSTTSSTNDNTKHKMELTKENVDFHNSSLKERLINLKNNLKHWNIRVDTDGEKYKEICEKILDLMLEDENNSQTKINSDYTNNNNENKSKSSSGIDAWRERMEWKEFQRLNLHLFQLEKKNHLASTKNWNGCINSTRKSNSSNYVQLNFTEGQLLSIINENKIIIDRDLLPKSYNTKLHQLVYFAHGGVWYDTNTHDVSHICSNSRCGNPDHVALEVKSKNLDRKGCKTKFLDCSKCQLRYFFFVCKHEPKCCKYISEETIDQKLRIKDGSNPFVCCCGKKMNLEFVLDQPVHKIKKKRLVLKLKNPESTE